MARLTKEEHDKIMDRLMGDEQNDEVDELIRKLRADFDESLRVDKKEAKEDVEDRGDKEVSRREVEDSYKEKYDDLYRKYKERFLDAKEEMKEAKEEQKEDVKEDSKKGKTYEELFKEKEVKSYGN
jgi:hypothetical protein